MARPTDCMGPSTCTGLSEVILSAKDVEIEDLGSAESRGDGQLVEYGEEACSSSYLGEGILINNPHLKIGEGDLGRLRYFYTFLKVVEI